MSWEFVVAGRPRGSRPAWSAGAMLVAFGVLMLLCPPGARAENGVFQVRACHDIAGLRTGAPFTPTSTGNARVRAFAACPSVNVNDALVSEAGGDGRGAAFVAPLTGAVHRVVAPGGMRLRSLDVELRSGRLDGSWALGLVTEQGPVPFGHLAAGGGAHSTGSGWVSNARYDLGGATELSAGIACGSLSGCSLRAGSARDAYFNMRDVTLEVLDETRPEVTFAGGSLLTGGWVSKEATLSLDAVDNSGVPAMGVWVDGTRLTYKHDAAGWCPANGFRCPNLSLRDHRLATEEWGEGVHHIGLVIADRGGNVTTYEGEVRVDRAAPARPVVQISDGEGWTTTRSRTVSWLNSDTERSDIVRAHYEVCKVETGDCRQSTAHGRGLEHIDGIEPFDGPGEYAIRVWLEDEAGNVDRDRASDPVRMRWDNTVPGLADPRETNGWLNRAEAAAGTQVTIDLAENSPSPPSGIAGFAVTLDGSDPGFTANVGGRTLHLTPDDLREGITVVRARAISGAGVPSSVAGSAGVRVDKSDPTAEVQTSAPSQSWARAPVTVLLVGTDQPGLSGIAAASSDLPVESGGYVSYWIDGGPEARARGPRASFILEDDGIHTVAFRATDAAGNASERGTIQVRIDRTPPAIGALSQRDANDPLEIAAPLGQDLSGTTGAVIKMRPAGSDRWFPLQSNVKSGWLVARVPDGLTSDGVLYEFEAEAVDGAGNRAYDDQTAGGSRLRVRAPFRTPTAISVSARAAGARDAGTIQVPFGSTATLTGRLRATDDQGVPRAPVAVDVREHVTGHPPAWRPIGTIHTGTDGRFTYALAAGPSRTLRFRFAGDRRLLATSGAASVLVRASTSIAASRRTIANGRPVVFSGRLRGGAVPGTGQRIDVQVWLRTRWRTIDVVRTDRTGRWRFPYRFETVTSGRPRFRWRVRIRPEADYPFLGATSRTLVVTVVAR